MYTSMICILLVIIAAFSIQNQDEYGHGGIQERYDTMRNDRWQPEMEGTKGMDASHALLAT